MNNIEQNLPTKIKAVFFDANGVIYYREDAHQHINKFLEDHRLPRLSEDKIRHAVTQVFKEAMVGRASKGQIFSCILRAHNITEQSLIKASFDALMRDESDILLFEGVVETLKKLKKHGYRLGIITDTISATKEKLRWFESKGLRIAWDAFSNSMETGVRKPHVTAYQTALSQAEVSAKESVFVGHTTIELEGANAIGMTTVAFRAEPEVRADYNCTHFTKLLKAPSLQQSAVV